MSKKKAILAVAVLVVALIVAALFIPEVYDPPSERIAITNVIICSSQIKYLVDKSIQSKISISDRESDECAWAGLSVSIRSGGEIYIRNAESSLELKLLPKNDSGNISWQCFGRPSEAFDHVCNQST